MLQLIVNEIRWMLWANYISNVSELRALFCHALLTQHAVLLRKSNDTSSRNGSYESILVIMMFNFFRIL
jgi:hypothetical protein